ncbi:MAG: putative ribosomal protein L22 [Streblomastix strix]|uniref:Large ribosomal subunit protein eL22 n=1 Tax=Streblomastix strix TaxID=222440 RepID=A0A5J4X933_9EUKA|nr:MAG: putative ribosomal protein L22 [Streblomastix strix]
MRLNRGEIEDIQSSDEFIEEWILETESGIHKSKFEQEISLIEGNDEESHLFDEYSEDVTFDVMNMGEWTLRNAACEILRDGILYCRKTWADSLITTLGQIMRQSCYSLQKIVHNYRKGIQPITQPLIAQIVSLIPHYGTRSLESLFELLDEIIIQSPDTFAEDQSAFGRMLQLALETMIFSTQKKNEMHFGRLNDDLDDLNTFEMSDTIAAPIITLDHIVVKFLVPCLQHNNNHVLCELFILIGDIAKIIPQLFFAVNDSQTQAISLNNDKGIQICMELIQEMIKHISPQNERKKSESAIWAIGRLILIGKDRAIPNPEDRQSLLELLLPLYNLDIHTPPNYIQNQQSISNTQDHLLRFGGHAEKDPNIISFLVNVSEILCILTIFFTVETVQFVSNYQLELDNQDINTFNSSQTMIKDSQGSDQKISKRIKRVNQTRPSCIKLWLDYLSALEDNESDNNEKNIAFRGLYIMPAKKAEKVDPKKTETKDTKKEEKKVETKKVKAEDKKVETKDEKKQEPKKQEPKKQEPKKQEPKKEAKKAEKPKKPEQADTKKTETKKTETKKEKVDAKKPEVKKEKVDTKATDKKATDKKPADKKTVDKKTTDKKETDKKATDKKATDKKPADKKETDKKATDKKVVDKQDTKKGTKTDEKKDNKANVTKGGKQDDKKIEKDDQKKQDAKKVDKLETKKVVKEANKVVVKPGQKKVKKLNKYETNRKRLHELKKIRYNKYAIACHAQAKDNIMQPQKLEQYLRQKIKIAGKTHSLAKHVKTKVKKDKVIVLARDPFQKRYLKYLTKRFLKKNALRDWIRVISNGKHGYRLVYYKIEQEDENAEAES